MPGIFISYRRSDSQSAAGRLCDSLEQRLTGASVFRDVETIEAGADFVDAITKALNSCDVLLAVIGPHWLDVVDAHGARRLDDPKDYTRLELSTALAREDVRVIPVLVDGATMPAAEALPENLKALARRNAVELTDKRWESDVADLMATLRRDLGLRTPTSTRPLMWLGAAVVILAAAGGFSWWRERQPSPAAGTAPAAVTAPATPAASPATTDRAKPADVAVPPAPAASGRAAAEANGAASVGPCPKSMSTIRDVIAPLTCTCHGTTLGSVWGTNTYTDDSDLCAAAIHAGAMGAEGGTVTVERAPGRALYVGTTRHGVQTSDYGRYPYSIRFAGGTPPPPGPESCPMTLTMSRDMGGPLTCVCSAEAAQVGTVWGTDVYTDDSKLCRAAVHAGVITDAGGVVTIERAGASQRYPGSLRHGVQSTDYGPYANAIQFRRP